MPLPPINAVCTSCKHDFTAVPIRSFLGLQKLICPACSTEVIYPLTSGYRTFYWIVFAVMCLTVFSELTQGNLGYPGGLGFAVIIALYKDWSVRNRIWKLTGNDKPNNAALICSIVAVIAAYAAAIAVPQFMAYRARANTPSIESQLLIGANNVNRKTPQMIDADTRIDGAVAGPGLSFTYLYTFPNIASTAVAQGAFDSKVAPNYRKSLCSSSEAQVFFANAVTVHYVYRGSDGGQIGTVTLTAKDCAAQ